MIEQIEALRETYGTASLVVWAAFALGIVFGFLAEFSGYCARAALAEWAPGNERAAAPANGYKRTKQYLTAVLVALVGTQALFFSENVDIASSIYWSVGINPLALIVGGAMFGIGMVLSGGCVSRLLVLAATGNARSMVTLIVTGLAGYATLRGILAYPRIWLENAWSTGVSAGAIYDAGPISDLAVAIIIGCVLLAGLAIVLARYGTRGLVSGALVGACVIAGWVITGIIGADEFEPMQVQSLTFIAPVGQGLQYLMIFTGDTITYAVAMLGGVLAGAFISSLIGGRLRYKGFLTEGSLVRYIAGGLLMGFGGVTALGCSVGQGLSGLSTASVSSVIAVLAIAAGGYAAMIWRARYPVEGTTGSPIQAAE